MPCLDAQNRVASRSSGFWRLSDPDQRVYPREVVKAALKHNAAAVVFAHNHPSGVAEPSLADERLTEDLSGRLRWSDDRVHDHFIVAGNSRPLSLPSADCCKLIGHP